MKNFWNWRFLVLLLALFVVAGLHLRPELRVPLGQDETVTVKKYASMDYEGTAETMRQVGHFDARRMAKGFVRCFYNTWDPNNHIVNSLLISGSAFLFGFNELAFRAPSLLALLLLIALAFSWIKQKTDSWLLAFLSGLVLIFHPYFAHYGATARGYIWSVLFVWLQIWLTQIFLRRKPTTGSILGFGLLSALIFFNLISMLATWIVPFYLALGLYLIAVERTAGQNIFAQIKNSERQRAWLYEGIVFLIAIVPFILSNLPVILNAQSKYGDHPANMAGILHQLAKHSLYFFPFPWGLLGLLGIAGCLLMLRRANFNWIGLVAIISIFTSLAYIFVTKTVPYPRVFGFQLALLLIGVTRLWDFCRLRPGVILLLVLTLAGQMVKGSKISEDSVSYGTLGIGVTEQIKANHDTKESAFIPLPWIYGEEMKFYLPENPDWFTMGPDKKTALNLYFITEKKDGTNRFRVQYIRRQENQMVYWDLPRALPAVEFPGIGSVIKTRVQVVRDFSGLGPGQIPWIVVWNSASPYFNLTGYVADRLARKQAPWTLLVNTVNYLPVKSLQLFVSNATELELAKQIIADLKEKSSGEMYLLVPEQF